MGRKAKIIGQVADAYGGQWDVREKRPTPHGFSVYLGWPHAVQRGQGGGGPRAILTQELKEYLENYRHSPKSIVLPLGRTAIKRLRRLLGHHYRHDRGLWWEDRFDDLISMSIEEFSQKHGVSLGAVSQWRSILVGPWLCKTGQEASREHVRNALQHPTCVAADLLGISAAHVRRLRSKNGIKADDKEVRRIRALRKKELSIIDASEDPRPEPREWSSWELSLLGRVPDERAAALLDMTLSEVSAKRKSLGIIKNDEGELDEENS